MQWEEDNAWLDASFKDMETTFPKVHLEEDLEKQSFWKLSVYPVFVLSIL